MRFSKYGNTGRGLVLGLIRWHQKPDSPNRRKGIHRIVLIISDGFLVIVRHKPISGFGARKPSSDAHRQAVILRLFGEKDCSAYSSVQVFCPILLSAPTGTERILQCAHNQHVLTSSFSTLPEGGETSATQQHAKSLARQDSGACSSPVAAKDKTHK